MAFLHIWCPTLQHITPLTAARKEEISYAWNS